MGATFCVEVQKENNKEELQEWLRDGIISSYIIYKTKDMTDVEK